MAHTVRDKEDRLAKRVRRIRRQPEAVGRALDDERDCSTVLHPIAACRGAMNGLRVEVLEGHVRMHVLDPDKKLTSHQAKAAQELLDVIKTYLR